MRTIVPSSLLRMSLLADAAASGLIGFLQVIAAGWLSELTKLAHGLVLGSGCFLLAYTGLVSLVARHAVTPWVHVAGIIVTNMAWAVGCMTLLALEAIAPTGIGVVYVMLQVVTFFSFSGLELAGLRVSRDAVADDASIASA